MPSELSCRDPRTPHFPLLFNAACVIHVQRRIEAVSGSLGDPSADTRSSFRRAGARDDRKWKDTILTRESRKIPPRRHANRASFPREIGNTGKNIAISWRWDNLEHWFIRSNITRFYSELTTDSAVTVAQWQKNETKNGEENPSVATRPSRSTFEKSLHSKG